MWGSTTTPAIKKIVAEEYKNVQTPSTEASSLYSFKEKKQYQKSFLFQIG